MNEELPLTIQRAIDNYEEVAVEELALFPVRVKEYELFLKARPALEIMQQSLPARLLSRPILQAFYQIDLELIASGLPPSGLLSSAILGLVLAIRVGEGKEVKERMKLVTVRHEEGHADRLKELSFETGEEEPVIVTPRLYRKLRPIIAAQNGIEQWGKEANPDLVEAERILRDKNSAKIKPDIRKEIMAVSVLTRTEKKEILEWPIMRLTETADSIRQMMDYAICAINQGAGCTWKGGNPVPHPWFERDNDGGDGLTELRNVGNGNAEKAVLAATLE